MLGLRNHLAMLFSAVATCGPEVQVYMYVHICVGDEYHTMLHCSVEVVLMCLSVQMI